MCESEDDALDSDFLKGDRVNTQEVIKFTQFSSLSQFKYNC